MAGYRARPWPVDDDLLPLLQSARDVQERVRTSRYSDDHTLGEWNEVVDILNRMLKVSHASGGQIDSPPADHSRDEYGERPDL